MKNRKLRMGMVGGGRGAFIGGVHRRAAALDGQIELVAGAFSSDPKKSALSGKDFFIEPSRVYASYKEMAKKEAAMPLGERIDFVSIVVRNHLHFEVAKTFLQAGINVICDKPATFTLAEARELKKIITKTKKVFALTHNYTGYPMVKLARQMVQKGEFRQDLLYRINTIELTLPSLKERNEDIRILAEHYLEQFAKKYNKDIYKFSEATIKRLEKYHWPGNVRELQHAVERAVIMSRDNILQPEDFFFNASNQPKDQSEINLEQYNLEDVERILIRKVLAKHNGNITHAAQELGLTRSSLYRRLEKYGL